MAETKKTKSTATETVFDVAKPGKTAPSSSSKPIIVTNRPVLKDPMVVEDDAAPDSEKPVESEQALAVPSVSKVKLAPLSEDMKAAESAKADAKEQETDKAEGSAATDDVTQEPDLDDGEGTSDDAKKQAPETDEAAERKASERQAELDKLIESRKYFLPINQVERRRSKHYAVVGFIVIVILGLAWVDIALDAGLITLPGVKAPTHFFK